MKIMFVTHGICFGGAERVTSLLVNEWAKLGHQVTLVVLDDKKQVVYPISEQVTMRFMQSARFDERGNLKTLIRTLRDHIKNEKPDAIVSFFNNIAAFAWAAALGTGVPLIFSERNDPYNNIKGIKAKLFQALVLNGAKRVVFQTAGAKEYYSKKIQKKSSIILNPLEIDKLPQREPENVDNRIVSVGRLCPQKNQEMLIRAFAGSNASDKHTLHIYGEGQLRPRLEALIAELEMQGKVFLEGNSQQVHEDIKNAKLFAFTSDYEGLPNALMEALAIGVPCVSTDCSPGGARMLIENGENGILIPCGDTAVLTRVFDELLTDEERLKKFSTNGQGLKNIVSMETIANRWLECINQVI